MIFRASCCHGVCVSLLVFDVDNMPGDKSAASSYDGANVSVKLVNICIITEGWVNEKMCYVVFE